MLKHKRMRRLSGPVKFPSSLPQQVIEVALCLVFLPATSCFAESDASAQLTLVANGQPASMIVISQNADEWSNRAAEWLQSYVQRATGAKLPIVSDDKKVTGTLVSVGHTRLFAKSAIDLSDLKWDGCKLVVRGDVLYLIGREEVRELKSRSWVGAHGTCRAVLTFLEDVCGVRWFLPSAEGELVPRSKDIRVSATLEKIFQPAFAYSDGRSVYDVNIFDEPGKSIAALANNYRKAVKVAGGGHTYGHAVPAERYFKDHPEYFALIKGRRTSEPYNQLCTSHPRVKQLLLDWTRMRLDEGIDWQAIGQSDSYARCQCPECDKLDDYRDSPPGKRWEEFQNDPEGLRKSPPERLFLLHKWVADEVAKSHPGKKIFLMCYGPTAWPSKKIAHFGDNVIGELMYLDPDCIRAWRGKVAGLAGYTYWFNSQCPMGINVGMTPREIAERIRYLHANGFVGLSMFPEANWGLEGPIFYTLGKLMGDPRRDHRALVQEYCRGVYGQAGDTMLQFFDLLYARLEVVLPLEKYDIPAERRNTKMPRGMSTTDLYLKQYPPAVLTSLDQLLQQAEAKADTGRTRGWLRLTRDSFDFVKLLTYTLISYRNYQAAGTPENWLEMKKRVEAFDDYRTKIVTYPKSHTDVWFPGHQEFCKYIVGGAVKESVSYYVPWETRKAEVLRKGIKGTAIGHGASYYYSFVKEPLTLNFSERPKIEQ